MKNYSHQFETEILWIFQNHVNKLDYMQLKDQISLENHKNVESKSLIDLFADYSYWKIDNECKEKFPIDYILRGKRNIR